MRELNPSVEFANKTGLAYSAVCKPLCQKLHLPQTAFDHLSTQDFVLSVPIH